MKNIEIERKFVIKYPDINYLLSLPNASSYDIEQIYILKKHGHLRIRKKTTNKETTYIKTIKHGQGLIREEFEEIISKNEYETLKNSSDLNPIYKTRIKIPSGKHIVEIDIYNNFSNYAIAEVELSKPDEELPNMSFISIIRDVTEEDGWSNFDFALNGMPKSP